MKKIMVVLILISSVKAYANENKDNGYHKHDGFFIRVLAGAGKGKAEIDYSGGLNDKFNGNSGSAIFQVGTSLNDNLILYYEQQQQVWGCHILFLQQIYILPA